MHWKQRLIRVVVGVGVRGSGVTISFIIDSLTPSSSTNSIVEGSDNATPLTHQHL
jgi:hypothetical protein